MQPIKRKRKRNRHTTLIKLSSIRSVKTNSTDATSTSISTTIKKDKVKHAAEIKEKRSPEIITKEKLHGTPPKRRGKRTIRRPKTRMTLTICDDIKRQPNKTVKVKKIKKIVKTHLTFENQYFLDPLDFAQAELEAMESLRTNSLAALIPAEDPDTSTGASDSGGEPNASASEAPPRRGRRLLRRRTFADTLCQDELERHNNTSRTLSNMADLFKNFEKLHKEEFQQVLFDVREKATKHRMQNLNLLDEHHLPVISHGFPPAYNASRQKDRQEITEANSEDSSRSHSLHSSSDEEDETINGPIHIEDPFEQALSPDMSPDMFQSSETMRLISKFSNTDSKKDVFSEEIRKELDEDPNMWLLSMDAMDSMQTPADVASMLVNLEHSIDLIDRYIPDIHAFLQNQDDSKMYLTAVIQELLKRAQSKGKLRGVQQDWSLWKGVNSFELVADDISKLVEYMAWLRNNIRASNVTDYNDAQQARMGAKEIKASLKRVLQHHESSSRLQSPVKRLCVT